VGGRGSAGSGGSVAAGSGGSIAATGGATGAGGSTATGGSTGTGGATGAGGAASALWRCPAGTFAPLTSTAALATPQRLVGAPPADNYAPGFSIIEGPVWLGDALYVSQILGGTRPPPSRILRIVPGSPATVFASNDGTNGLAILPDGDLVGAIHIDGSVCRVPLANPNGLIPIAYFYATGRFNAPNDLAVRGDGNIYFSDPDATQALSPPPQPLTRVYRISPLPASVVSVVDDTLSQPNGVTLSLDEQTLYVSGPGLYKYPVRADGSVGPRQPAVANPPMYAGSDGMVIDCAGDLYVAQNQSVVVINPAGVEVGRINVSGVQAVTNLAFGGADHRTLFITTLDGSPGVFTVAMPLPGMPY
jgi:gluconolactonase